MPADAMYDCQQCGACCIDYFGTEDPSQGGDATRHTLSFDLESPLGDGVDTNDVAFASSFPYLALPHAGSDASPH